MIRNRDAIGAAHQITLLAGARKRDGNRISVSCTCLAPVPWRRPRVVIEARARFPAAEARKAWREWHEREGIPL